ncbi:hypothetical protein [Halobaculum marinum]|uniref:hypothetical protein n=1 Tax=Halobaculum marinum TaxID=3031996 RepID=UPI0023E43458|nr:hypothetical protein [Halobaculum sp. DT55]
MEDDPDLFLAPCSREHKETTIKYFRDTVLEGIDPAQYQEVADLGYEGRTPVWGVVSSKKSTWEQMDEGDVVLYYTKAGEYTHCATVSGKLADERIARHIWEPYDEGRTVDDIEEPWTYMFFLRNVQEVDIPAEVVHGTLGYEMEYPLGFMRPSDTAHSTLRGEYNNVESFLTEQGYAYRRELETVDSGDQVEEFSPSSLRDRSGSSVGTIEDNPQSIESTINPAETERKKREHETILDFIEERLTAAGFHTGETSRSDLIAIGKGGSGSG